MGRPELVGPAQRAALTALTEGWLAGLLGDEPDVALVAVGAYGRREPAAGSDLDLLLLHRNRRGVAAVAERLWYPVWDSGVGLDHSVRTVPEALKVAASDLRAALGLLDARHLAGDRSLSGALVEAARTAWRTAAPARLPELAAAVQERAERCGELAFLLEPDLKEARGGLRDVQALRAVAAAWVVDAPPPAVLSAYGTLLDVRGELHRRTGRNADRLLLQEQDEVAAALGYPDADALLVDVYAAGRTISYAGDGTWRRVSAWLGQRRWRRRPSPGRPVRRPLADGVVEQDGEVVLARDADPAADPVLVLRAAAAAAAAGLPLSPHALDRLARYAPPLPEPWPPDARDALVALLGTGRAAVAVLESLDQAGLLVRLLPEWERVRCRPQRNAYHRYTVDRHLMEATAVAAGLTRQVARPDLLLLGALLHDIGKGYPGDHTSAGEEVVARLAPRLGLDRADTEVLCTLVRHHLLLPDTATRRDLDDPATVARVVAAVDGAPGTLDLLHALTEADALATGPAAWGDWKSGLVADLVRRTGAVLRGGPLPEPTGLTAAQRELAAAGVLAVQMTPTTVTVAAPDRPGLLWRAAGVLALHRLDVRAATAGTVGCTGVVAFEVAPQYGSTREPERLRDDLRRVLSGQLPVQERLAEREQAYARPGRPIAPPWVEVLNGASATSTVIEVRAHDAAGLLFRICRALAAAGLDVRAARISTLGAEVVDAFYVVEETGEKLTDPCRREAVATALLAALGSGPPEAADGYPGASAVRTR